MSYHSIERRRCRCSPASIRHPRFSVERRRSVYPQTPANSALFSRAKRLQPFRFGMNRGGCSLVRTRLSGEFPGIRESFRECNGKATGVGTNRRATTRVLLKGARSGQRISLGGSGKELQRCSDYVIVASACRNPISCRGSISFPPAYSDSCVSSSSPQWLFSPFP